MAANVENDRFLGVRWRTVWSVVAEPWQQRASDWFLVRALTPWLPISLNEIDGRRSSWLIGPGNDMVPTKMALQLDHAAVELPQSLVLHRRITLPRLENSELHRAIRLDAIANSPFPMEDLCWGSRVVSSAQNSPSVSVELVLASRRQINDCLVSRDPSFRIDQQLPEVWVASEISTAQYIVFEGFGELERLRRHRFGRVLNISLVAVVMALLGVIAITPTLQLRMRAIAAVKAYDELYIRSRNAVASRETLVRSVERVQQIEGLLRETIDPAQALNILTEVLPEDASLTGLQIKGRKVIIEGQATNAAELMQLLGKQPGFDDVVAPAPATRPFGSNKDNFKIEFMFDASRAVVAGKAKS